MFKCDFVIVTKNLRLAERAVASIQESCADYLGSIIMVMRPETQFTTGADQGWRAGREEFVCFVNDDAFPTGKALKRMFETFVYEKNVGAVGPGIPCRTHQGGIPPSDKQYTIDVPFLVSGCLLVRRSVLEEIGGWDTDFVLYACDLDLSFRIRDAGYRCLWVRDAWVNHIVGSTEHKVENKDELWKHDHDLLAEKFPGRFERECQIIPHEAVCERPDPDADGLAKLRYQIAKDGMNGAKRVLDVGCGFGSGSHIFADREYVGIEIDPLCIAYNKTNLQGEFHQISADKPYDLGTFDAVCAFESIEHVKDVDGMLANIARAMAPEARAWFSTPLRKGVFNPHHVQEWSREELVDLLGRYFEDVTVDVRDFNLIAPTLWAECGRPRG